MQQPRVPLRVANGASKYQVHQVFLRSSVRGSGQPWLSSACVRRCRRCVAKKKNKKKGGLRGAFQTPWSFYHVMWPLRFHFGCVSSPQHAHQQAQTLSTTFLSHPRALSKSWVSSSPFSWRIVQNQQVCRIAQIQHPEADIQTGSVIGNAHGRLNYNSRCYGEK